MRFRYLSLLISLGLAGCGEPGGPALVPDRPAAAPTADTAAADAAPADPRPALGEPMELDQGRLTAAGPKGWARPPRDPKWLARFELSAGTPYPTILIHAPVEVSGQKDVTQENAPEFARRLHAELKAELAASGYKVPEVKPVVLANFAGAEYSRQARLQGRNVNLDRLYLVTVWGGRQYTIELQALHGTETTFRPHALAVAEGLKFQAKAATSDPATPGQ